MFKCCYMYAPGAGLQPARFCRPTRGVAQFTSASGGQRWPPPEGLGHAAKDAGKTAPPGQPARGARPWPLADEEGARESIGKYDGLKAQLNVVEIGSEEEGIQQLDQTQAKELGVELTQDAEADPERVGRYYLRLACRMIPPFKKEVSTNAVRKACRRCRKISADWDLTRPCLLNHRSLAGIVLDSVGNSNG